MGKFAVPLNIRKQKVFQLQGGFAPLTPRPGALPLDPIGGFASRPPYRLALCVLAMAPLIAARQLVEN